LIVKYLHFLVIAVIYSDEDDSVSTLLSISTLLEGRACMKITFSIMKTLVRIYVKVIVNVKTAPKVES